MKPIHLFPLAILLTACTLHAEDAIPALAAPATRPALSLLSPPAARTHDSLALLWDKPASTGIEAYDINLDNTLLASTKDTDYTLQNLPPAHAYNLSVRARLTNGTLLQSNTLHLVTKPPPKEFDITQYGAIADGKTLNTKAIQSAIDACTPNGTVRIPKGTFLSGALFLKSDITLHLDEGATLLGKPRHPRLPS